MRRRLRAAAAPLLAGLFAGALALTGGAAAQGGERRDSNPDPSVEIEQVRVGAPAVGGSVGGGRLHFRGEVFGLAWLEDFPGRYEEEVAPTPPGGEGGPETRWLRNAAGVEMRLQTERAGGVLRISPGGVTIEFR